MKLTIATFNLNNLFSRYNFDLQAEVPSLGEGTVSIEKIKTVVGQAEKKEIEYKGIGLHRKDPAERQTVAARIKTWHALLPMLRGQIAALSCSAT
jgi:hypothetical protein